MGTNTNNYKNLSTTIKTSFDLLLEKFEEDNKKSSNISEKIKKLNELKSEFNKLSSSLLKTMNSDKVKTLQESFKKSK